MIGTLLEVLVGVLVFYGALLVLGLAVARVLRDTGADIDPILRPSEVAELSEVAVVMVPAFDWPSYGSERDVPRLPRIDRGRVAG